MARTDAAQRSGRMSRQRIVEIAFAHFAEHGYRGASLARIAVDVGISQAGLLHHFPNKSALLEAVLRERDGRDMAAIGVEVDDLTRQDLTQMRDRFVAIVEHNLVNRHVVQLAHLTVAGATTPDHPGRAWVRARQDFAVRACAAAVQRGIDDGTVRAVVDPTAIAHLLVAASEGLENQWLVHPGVDLAARFREYADELIAGIRA